jgi:hypothetical protein
MKLHSAIRWNFSMSGKSPRSAVSMSIPSAWPGAAETCGARGWVDIRVSSVVTSTLGYRESKHRAMLNTRVSPLR